VLGLAQQVGGGDLGIGAPIDHDRGLARPCRQVDRALPVHGEFGGGHPGAAGTDDLAHPADGFGPIGERSDRLGSPDRIHLVDAE
jgi:hypothetical protein